MSRKQRRAKKAKDRERRVKAKVAQKREITREKRRLANELAKMKEEARERIPPIVNEEMHTQID